MKHLIIFCCILLSVFSVHAEESEASLDTQFALKGDYVSTLQASLKLQEKGEEIIQKIDTIIQKIKYRRVKVGVLITRLESIENNISTLEENKRKEVSEILHYFKQVLLKQQLFIQIEDEKLEQERIQKEKEEQENIVIHIKTPDSVKSIYYTAYSAASSKKVEYLKNLVKNKEINSVTIDIKTVTGYVSFDMSDGEFGTIKPVSNKSIRNAKALVKELHEAGIYVIGRVVVFKDKLLSEKRSDLAIKWLDGKNVWYDYKGLKYLDPGAKEVWDYNANIANYAYEIGFDEINFDYVRFPTDGKISSTYYPHSHTTQKNNPKWGKIMTLDKFSNYITKKIREKHPDAILSADVFGLVTRNEGYMIGQNLESFLLYFDFVGPMIYPSHYGKGFLGNSVPDNAPYAVIKDAMEHTNAKVEKLNKAIDQATASGSQLKIKNAFFTDADISELSKIDKNQVRPWLQGFTCTWCRGATEYNRTKFREQIRALEDTGIHSWWVWSSSSRYYWDWYNK